MNFKLTEDQILIRDMVRSFAENEIKPAAQALEDRHEYPSELLDKLAGLGILGMSVPPEYGGSGADSLSFILAIEEISRVMPSLAVIVSVHGSLFCTSILNFGTEQQKKEYLPRAARGELIGAFSLTEPGAGSDALALKTTAVRDGDDYVLNGTKAWVTTGSRAGAIILIAANGEPSGTRRLNGFIVESGTPGMTIGHIEEKMGMHASLTAEILLEDCRIPAANRLGEEGQGAKIAFKGLDGSRIGIAAQSVGIGQSALDEACGYAGQREAFGRKISEFQAIQFKLADIATRLDAARLLTYRAAALYESGGNVSKAAAMAKLFASETANFAAYESLQIHGGYGYSREFPIERIFRDARVLTIYEGTSEIQRMLIARHIMKD